VNADTREIAFLQKLVQFHRTCNRFDKDDDLILCEKHRLKQPRKPYLVEIQCVQQIIQLAVFARFFELDEVLLQSMQGKLGLVIDKDLERLRKRNHYRPCPNSTASTHVRHEFFAGDSDILGECGAEHHDLFRVRCDAKDLLDVSAHVWLRKSAESMQGPTKGEIT